MGRGDVYAGVEGRWKYMDEVNMGRRYLVMDGKWVSGNIGVLKWSYYLVVDEILNLMTKAVATIGAMTMLLMIHIVLGGVMSGMEWVRQRLRIKGFEILFFRQDF